MSRPFHLSTFILFIFLATSARAVINDVGGSQYGRMIFQQTLTYGTQKSMAIQRYTMPTTYPIGQANLWTIEDTNFEVLDATDNPYSNWWIDQAYLTGYPNSGVWIVVNNPHPGAPFVFKVRYMIQDFTGVNAYGVNRDIPTFSPGTSYTFQVPGGLMDSTSPTITSATNTTVNTYTPSSGTVAGVRGRVESIMAATGNRVTFRSPTPGMSNRMASQVWNDRYGDCDDFITLVCAELHAYGIACRTVLTGVTGAPTPNIFTSSPPTLHGIGELWNGDNQWETWEPDATINFAGASQVFIGAGNDFTWLYPIQDPVFFASLLGGTNAGTTAVSNAGDFYVDPTGRNPGNKNYFAQRVSGTLQNAIGGTPYDQLGLIGSGVDVPNSSPKGLSFSVRPFRNPSRGPVAAFVTIPSSGRIKGELYDVAGRKVPDVPSIDQAFQAGQHLLSFTSSSLTSGVYFIFATYNGKQTSARIVVQR